MVISPSLSDGLLSEKSSPRPEKPEELPFRALLIEADEARANYVARMIQEGSEDTVSLEHVQQLEQGITALEQGSIQVVLIGLDPAAGLDGQAVIQLMATGRSIPILVLDQVFDTAQATALLQQGVQDYLVWDQLNGTQLSRSIHFAMERQWAKQHLELDIDRAKQLSCQDSLTGLVNREYCQAQLEQAIDRSARGKHKVAFLYLDLDHFKPINDTYGHLAGDFVLKTVAQRLQECVRETDTCARLGGDEFGIVLPMVRANTAVVEIVHRLLEAISRPILLGQEELFTTASIGISLYPWDGLRADELINCADLAMYRAKSLGGNLSCFFSAEADKRAVTVVSIGRQIRHALDGEELFLEYQPALQCRTRDIFGVEALLRWEHPTFGLIRPDEFIPEAERLGLIAPLTEWVMDTACRQLKQWSASTPSRLFMTINISAMQIHQRQLVQLVEQTLDTYQLPGASLCLELSDRQALADWERATDVLLALKSLGIRLALDDFGCGFASLNYLTSLPFDILKINPFFVHKLFSSSSSATVVRDMITMAHNLGLVVVAEGVETKDQFDYLRALECDAVQGYYFFRPSPAEVLDALFQQPALGYSSRGGGGLSTARTKPPWSASTKTNQIIGC